LGSRFLLPACWDKKGKKQGFGQERRNGVLEETKKQVVEVKIYRNIDLALPVA